MLSFLAPMFLAGAAHAVISLVWYYQWNLTTPVGIDGGPLAFLSWSIPLLVGSLAYDSVNIGRKGITLAGLAIACGAMLMCFAGNSSAALPFTGPDLVGPRCPSLTGSGAPAARSASLRASWRASLRA